jgi:hypothetical protein
MAIKIRDIIRELVEDVFKDDIFRISAYEVTDYRHNIIISCIADMRCLHLTIEKTGRIGFWIHSKLFWLHYLHDPDAINQIKGRLVEFSQKKLEDLKPDKFDNEWWEPYKSKEE